MQTWAAIAGLVGIAERFWNRDHRWRAPLTRAVFPFYIVHQSLIVVAAYWLIPWGWEAWPLFIALVAFTAAAGAIVCMLAFRIPLLGSLMGVPKRRPFKVRDRRRLGLPFAGHAPSLR